MTTNIPHRSDNRCLAEREACHKTRMLNDRIPICQEQIRVRQRKTARGDRLGPIVSGAIKRNPPANWLCTGDIGYGVIMKIQSRVLFLSPPPNTSTMNCQWGVEIKGSHHHASCYANGVQRHIPTGRLIVGVRDASSYPSCPITSTLGVNGQSDKPDEERSCRIPDHGVTGRTKKNNLSLACSIHEPNTYGFLVRFPHTDMRSLPQMWIYGLIVYENINAPQELSGPDLVGSGLVTAADQSLEALKRGGLYVKRIASQMTTPEVLVRKGAVHVLVRGQRTGQRYNPCSAIILEGRIEAVRPVRERERQARNVSQFKVSIW
ncbi:hypothetical protein PAXINDRAFT_158982 [Paxillus involutus ATCC 200175]|uniref:Uncharacterized protein n=1 Tax=Paxillus involutus ATCC 200175 TaxID=664439 RepID=A0A0C9TBN8_PAXIN|nr:hypothetical protein PAXINDRAFT_158982 [Paxillus involutus ATCC 200175]